MSDTFDSLRHQLTDDLFKLEKLQKSMNAGPEAPTLNVISCEIGAQLQTLVDSLHERLVAFAAAHPEAMIRHALPASPETEPLDVVSILSEMRLKPGGNAYRVTEWVLRNPGIEFTIEEAAKGSKVGYGGTNPILHEIRRGKIAIPGFKLSVVNDGHAPIIYKLIRK